MHRYNNHDHSRLTTMLSVENIFGAHHDVWNVNVEQEYHDEKVAAPPTRTSDDQKSQPAVESASNKIDGGPHALTSVKWVRQLQRERCSAWIKARREREIHSRCK